MIRAAAKNHEDVAVVVDAADYQAILDAMDALRRLATRAAQETGAKGLCANRRL